MKAASGTANHKNDAAPRTQAQTPAATRITQSYRCRANAQGAVILPAALARGFLRDGIATLHAYREDGHAVFAPLDRAAAAIARLSPFLTLAEADLASAETIAAVDFGAAAAKAFPVGLDTPVVGPLPL
jgi:hypothetical protein